MISVVIPVYNAAECIAAVTTTVENALLAQQMSYEIILVDDNSSSATRQVLAQLALKPSCQVYYNDVNIGQQPSTLIGIQRASGDIVITMDDDGQHDTKVLIQLIEQVQKSCDVAFAIEEAKKRGGAFFLPSRWVSGYIRWRFPMGWSYWVSSYRAFRRALIPDIDPNQNFFYLSCELLKNAKSVCNIDYKAMQNRQSRYTLLARIQLFINLIKTYGW